MHDYDFSKFMLHVKRGRMMGTLGMMDFCLKKSICVPKCSLCELLLKAHARGIMSHFGIQKTLAMLHEHFYWPGMRHDVYKYYVLDA